jgi:hypothetical protein
MRMGKNYIELCSNYYANPHSNWLCKLTGLITIELSLCFGFSYHKVYYDGYHYNLRLGFICINWER